VITDEFLSADPAGEDAVKAARDAIRKRLDRDELDAAADHLVGIGGTLTTMAAVKHRMVNYDPDVIRGTVLTARDVSDQIRLYSSMPLEQRKEIPGLQPKRADIILGGACIVSTILETFSTEQVVVSDRGLRHGLVCDRFGTSAS
jgi:exopolyphosphatase/guanosine-5'-triphosphate,3'-diphosphate pyrophosphatase